MLALLLAIAIEGEAALRHAKALSALGPHPWGSTRNEAAAQYVASQMRAIGLDEVELQRFERNGLQGSNVVGWLRGASDEIVLVGAHHDTAPGAPGAYDDAAGVGVLLEVAQVLASDTGRRRSLAIVSFDGEEAEVLQKGKATGSRAFLERLGPRSRSVTAAFVIEMCGWPGGRPVLHPIAYAHPLAKEQSVIAPGWLVRAALAGSRREHAPISVGDPYLSWLYQPAVRTFRVRLYGDDFSFLQAGRPALFTSDSSFSRFYPDYHQATDVAEHLDAKALATMGRGVVGVVRELDRVPAGPVEQPHWFALFGSVVDWPWLLGLGVLSLLPGLRAGFAGGGLPFFVRLAHAAAFLVLLWFHPVPALWVFLLPNLLLPFRRRWFVVLLALAPGLGLVVFGSAAWWRGAVNGLWPTPWQLGLCALTLVLGLTWFRTPLLWGGRPGAGGGGPKGRRRRAAGLPKRRG